MRATLLIGLVACAGCNQILGIGDIAVVAHDGPGGEPMGQCVGSGLIKVCSTRDQGSIMLTDVNTDTDSRCDTQGQPAGPMTCAIAGQDITVPGDVTVTGSRPLVLVAKTTITIDAKLDASSEIGQSRGAGANYDTCVAGSGNNDNNGGGGGAGGTFGGSGGNGGNGGGGTAGGQATPVGSVNGVRGGCPGARGGNAPTTDIGGDGGGAMYLIAGTSITLTGSGHIYATGAAGKGGLSHNGGYGGGSGGFIGLEAPAIMLMGSASISANGGGGGEGGSTQTGVSGRDGHDGTHDNTAAQGGSGGTSSGGDGGDGSAGTNVDGTIGTNGNGSGAGGGGGGGGAGIVWVTTTPSGGLITPPPQLHP